MPRTTIAIVVAAVIVLFGAIVSHNPQAARFVDKQAAIAETSTATSKSVSIREWDTPTRNSHPHDPAVAPDGSLWYAAQLANKLGRLDPESGEIKEFPLDVANSGPHGLVADTEGNIWFTANFQGYIGKLNPMTGAIARYPMPDARAGDPHTPVFDSNGVLWFTVQGGNFVGKLDPASGEITLRQPHTPNALPYGIVISPEGVPYFCELGAN